MAKAAKPSNTAVREAKARWPLLHTVYHCVLALSPSPEAAKIAIMEAHREKRLRMRATRLEYRARPDLRLAPGEKPPPNPPIITPNCPLPVPEPDDSYWEHWDWERNIATHRDCKTRSLFRYEHIEVHPDDVSSLWPPTKPVKSARPADKPRGRPKEFDRDAIRDEMWAYAYKHRPSTRDDLIEKVKPILRRKGIKVPGITLLQELAGPIQRRWKAADAEPYDD
jgi:hypothetical protein